MLQTKIKDNELAQQMLHLVVPIAIQQFMLALVSATDALMLGFVDQASLSAVSLAGQIQFVLNLFIAGIAAGCGIIIAQYWGKKDTASIEKVMPVALYTNLIFGGTFTVLALCIPSHLMQIFTNDATLIANGTSYLRAVAFSYVLCGISQIYLILLKNTGHAALSSKISSTAVVINICLNTILIFGFLGAPRLGIAFVLYSVILGHMGSDAVAANSIASIVKSMVQCVIRGVSAGAGILVGNLLGANQLEKAKNYGGRITHIAIVIGIVTGTLLMILSPFISRIAPISDTARGYLQFMMIVLGFNLMGQSVNTTVLDGIFCAGGDSKFDMKGNLGAMWCFSVPLGFIAAFVLHAPVWLVYIIISLDEIVKLPAVYIHYKKYVWVRNITR